MVAAVSRFLGIWEFGKSAESPPVRPCSASPADYADALSAGWVPPLPDVPVESRSAKRMTGGEDDADAFLARVYLHQQC